MAFDRDTALAELGDHIWRYLSGYGVETSSTSSVAGLFGLSPQEVRQLLAAHLALSPATTNMLRAATALLPRLQGSMGRSEREMLGEAEGGVDWYRTLQRRLDLGEPTLFACTPPLRRYDTIHARAIATALQTCENLARSSGFRDGPQGHNIAGTAVLSRRLLSHGKLAGIRPLQSLTADRLNSIERREGYGPIVRYLRLATEGIEHGRTTSVYEILTSSVLAPRQNSAVYEFLVGFRIVDLLIADGFRVRRLQAHRDSRQPFAILEREQRSITIWRQRSLVSVLGLDSTASAYSAIRRNQGLRASALVPDYVLQASEPDQLVAVEIKLSEGRSMAHVRTGLVEALAYWKDLEPAFSTTPNPHVLVVASDVEVVPDCSSPVALCSDPTLGVALRHALALV